MSMCAGKTSCEIYRDKRFCRRPESTSIDKWYVCNCSHARLPCQVGTCMFEKDCRNYEIMKEAEHGKV